jgi:hypothetical protein
MLQTTPSLSRNVGKASRAVYGKIAGTAIRLAERASRSTFGNVAGLRSNLDGAVEEARLRFRRRYPTDAARTLRSTGYQAMSPVDRSVMERIRSAYVGMIDDEAMSRPNGHTGALRQGLCFSRIVEDLFEKIPESRAVMTDEVAAIVRAYYGTDFKIQGTSAWRIHHVPGDLFQNTDLFSNRWHCDNRPTTWLKIFVHLQDISDADGPFHVLSLQDTRQAIKIGFANRTSYGSSLEFLNAKAYRSVGPMGSILLTNTTRCLHRAGLAAEGHSRDMIEVKFAPI